MTCAVHTKQFETLPVRVREVTDVYCLSSLITPFNDRGSKLLKMYGVTLNGHCHAIETSLSRYCSITVTLL